MGRRRGSNLERSFPGGRKRPGRCRHLLVAERLAAARPGLKTLTVKVERPDFFAGRLLLRCQPGNEFDPPACELVWSNRVGIFRESGPRIQRMLDPRARFL